MKQCPFYVTMFFLMKQCPFYKTMPFLRNNALSAKQCLLHERLKSLSPQRPGGVTEELYSYKLHASDIPLHRALGILHECFFGGKQVLRRTSHVVANWFLANGPC